MKMTTMMQMMMMVEAENFRYDEEKTRRVK
jgi:hypothetical protein